MRRSESSDDTGHRHLPPIYELYGEHTAGRPFKPKRTLTRANAILAGRWYKLPHTLPSHFNAQQQKSCPAPASSTLPSASVDGKATMMPPSADVPEARFPTCAALTKFDAYHSSQAQETRMSTFQQKAEETAMCRSS